MPADRHWDGFDPVVTPCLLAVSRRERPASDSAGVRFSDDEPWAGSSPAAEQNSPVDTANRPLCGRYPLPVRWSKRRGRAEGLGAFHQAADWSTCRGARRVSGPSPPFGHPTRSLVYHVAEASLSGEQDSRRRCRSLSWRRTRVLAEARSNCRAVRRWPRRRAGGRRHREGDARRAPSSDAIART